MNVSLCLFWIVLVLSQGELSLDSDFLRIDIYRLAVKTKCAETSRIASPHPLPLAYWSVAGSAEWRDDAHPSAGGSSPVFESV